MWIWGIFTTVRKVLKLCKCTTSLLSSPLSNHYNVCITQLPVFCSILAFVIMWYRRFSSCTGYLLSTGSSTSCVHWCTRSTLDTGYTQTDSVQSITESSRRPGLRSADTADYINCHTCTKFGERSFSHARPDAWNSLPDNIKLTTDTNRCKRLLKSHLFRLAFWHFVSAPGQFVSRSLQICIRMQVIGRWLWWGSPL